MALSPPTPLPALPAHPYPEALLAAGLIPGVLEMEAHLAATPTAVLNLYDRCCLTILNVGPLSDVPVKERAIPVKQALARSAPGIDVAILRAWLESKWGAAVAPYLADNPVVHRAPAMADLLFDRAWLALERGRRDPGWIGALLRLAAHSELAARHRERMRGAAINGDGATCITSRLAAGEVLLVLSTWDRDDLMLMGRRLLSGPLAGELRARVLLHPVADAAFWRDMLRHDARENLLLWMARMPDAVASPVLGPILRHEVTTTGRASRIGPTEIGHVVRGTPPDAFGEFWRRLVALGRWDLVATVLSVASPTQLADLIPADLELALTNGPADVRVAAAMALGHVAGTLEHRALRTSRHARH